jgi:hypothetical protein
MNTQDRKPVINQDIQVESVSSKQASTGNMKWIITDTNKLKYFFWQKNNGQDCETYQTFLAMGVKKGDWIHIGFTESDEFFVNKEGQTVNYKDRFILGIREAGASPTPALPKSSNLGHPVASQTPSVNQGRNYDQEGYEKCAWTYFIEVCNGELDSFAKALQDGVVHDAFQAIKADSAKHFSPFRQAVQKHAPKVVSPEEDLPVIQQEDDIGESIPF